MGARRAGSDRTCQPHRRAITVPTASEPRLAESPATAPGFGPLAETIQVRHDSLEEMEQTFARVGPERVAAVFMEPVIGAGGVYPPAPGLHRGRRRAVPSGPAVLLVVDAVICAFGRLGTWFGIERWNVEPAMIVFAKGVTSGYLPLGGVMVSERIAEPFWREPGGPIFRHGADLRRAPDVLRGRRSRTSRCSSATAC